MNRHRSRHPKRHPAFSRCASLVAPWLLAAGAGLTLSGCADQLLGAATRAQDRQCSQLVVPEQREGCLRDVNGTRPVAASRDLERPRPVPADAEPGTPAVRKDDAAARAARRGAAEAPAAAASAP